MKKNFLWLTILLACCSCLMAQEGVDFFSKDFTAEEFQARRAKVVAEIGKESLAIIQGAPEPRGYVKFRQTNEFYYLCGLESPHAYLVIDGATGKSSLYLKSQNPRVAAFEGKRLTKDDAGFLKKASGVDNVYGLEELVSHLNDAAATQKYKFIFTPLPRLKDWQYPEAVRGVPTWKSTKIPGWQNFQRTESGE